VIVVADAGPLIHLGAIGRLELIRRLSPEVLVPRAAFDEVVVVGAGLPGADEVRAASWLSVVTPAGGDVVTALLAGGLHRGEAEAIAVAVERRADRLLALDR
jgi:predicted nucleic acid-binding protein